MEILKLKEVVIRGKAGDKEALAQLFNETNQMVYFTALKLSGNENDAQDVAQETFIKAFNNIHTLVDEQAFLKWLKIITVNICKNYLKRKTPLLFESEEKQKQFIESVPELDDNFLPEEYVQKKEKTRLVMEIIDRLPESQKVTVILYYYDELSILEIADIMEVSAGTVKSRLNYARKFIKDEVEKLENKGTVLCSVSALPVLTSILFIASENYSLKEDSSELIFSRVLESVDKQKELLNTGIDSVTNLDETKKGNTIPNSKVALSEKARALSWPIAAKFMAASIGMKIIVVIVAATLMVASIIGVNNKFINKNSKNSSEKEMLKKLGNRKIEELLGLNKDHVVSIFGKPDNIDKANQDNEETYIYKDTNRKNMLTINFIDNQASLITCYEGDFTIDSVKLGDTYKQLKKRMETDKNISSHDEKEGSGNYLSNIRYSKGEYNYGVFYKDKGIIEIISVSKPISKENVETQEKVHNNIITSAINPKELFGKSKAEILQILGKPNNTDTDEYKYFDSNKDELNLSFREDGKVFEIDYNGKVLPLGHIQIPIGSNIDGVLNYLSSIKSVERIGERYAFGVNTIFKFYSGGCEYEVLADQNKIVYKVLVKNAESPKYNYEGVWKEGVLGEHSSERNYNELTLRNISKTSLNFDLSMNRGIVSINENITATSEDGVVYTATFKDQGFEIEGCKAKITLKDGHVFLEANTNLSYNGELFR